MEEAFADSVSQDTGKEVAAVEEVVVAEILFASCSLNGTLLSPSVLVI